MATTGNSDGTMKRQLLIIEKENSLRTALAQHLQQEGFLVSETDREDQVVPLLSGAPIRLVLLSLQGFKRQGIAMMRTIRQAFPDVKIITINSGNQLDLSIEGMRLGAFDDFLIPFDLDELMICVRNAFAEPSSRPPTQK